MKTFYHSPTAKISLFLQVFYHLGLILPKYHTYRVKVFYDDGHKKVFTCNASVLFSSLSNYDDCVVYVFGLFDEFETLIIEQNEFGVILFD